MHCTCNDVSSPCGPVCWQDSIHAVPMAFYEAAELEERERFLESCDFIDGSLG